MFSKKNGSQVLAPEKVNVHEWYTLSLNFDLDKLFKSHGIHSLSENWKRQAESIVEHFKFNKCTYLVPELSAYGRLHWHGIIKFNHMSHVGIFYGTMPRLLNISHVEVDTISDMKKWLEYCNKGVPYMKTLAKTYSMAYEPLDGEQLNINLSEAPPSLPPPEEEEDESESNEIDDGIIKWWTDNPSASKPKAKKPQRSA